MGAKRIDPIRTPKSETKLAYIAGLVDGEGCICIASSFDKKSSINVSHQLVVRINNTDERLISWLKSEIGGSVHCRGTRKQGWKVLYDWYVCSTNAATFLQAVLPYLIIKKTQAELALEFCVHKSKARVIGQALNKSTSNEREAMKHRLNLLNKRGA